MRPGIHIIISLQVIKVPKTGKKATQSDALLEVCLRLPPLQGRTRAKEGGHRPRLAGGQGLRRGVTSGVTPSESRTYS